MSAETEVKETEKVVVAEAEKVATELDSKTKEAEDKEQAFAKQAKIDITTEEKLALRDAEAIFLRAQVEIRDLQVKMKDLTQKAELASKTYTTKLDELVKKYAISKVSHFFDNLEGSFKALGKKL